MGRLALILFSPIWLLYDLRRLIYDPVTGGAADLSQYILGLLFLDGILNWLQNIIAFSVLSIVTPLTYAVASASKRIFVIAVTLFVLGNPVTWLNVFGMTLAICGVMCYNKAKYDQRKESQSALPKYYDKSRNGDSSSSFMINGWTGQKPQLFPV